MAMQGPVGRENLEISFRLQSKTSLIDGTNNSLFDSKCNVVASASCHGIVFVGTPKPELLVVCLKDLETSNQSDQGIPTRKLNLPSPTTQIAVNCDSSILAVVVKLNGSPHLQMYSVPSFLTPNIQKIREFRLSNDNADAVQLCWNPVISSTLALCTETGALNTYTVKEQGIEPHAIDPNLKAKCCCWSPKGKQIVVGFSNGKLMQFTPELKPAKSIDCPAGIIQGSFDTIAIQWLSTFQFAAAFLSHQPDSRPLLHIINAPKAGPPQYIAYNDVCYSSTESRPSRFYLQHIMAWNMLLVSSANSIDVSFLRISQAGDLPVWTQEFPNDMYPAELPLTASKDESFPLGFEIETGCSGRLLQEDGSPYPVMPMIHILSTDGVLCSFYVLNTTESYIDICSPPRPIDQNALFTVSPTFAAPQQSQQPEQETFKTPTKVDIPFTQPIGQSTPTIPKFQLAPQLPPPSMSLFGSSLPQTFGQNIGAPTQSAFQAIAKTTAPLAAPTVKQTQSQPQMALVTASANYKAPTVTANKIEAVKPVEQKTSSFEDEQVYARMIQDEMRAFELEFRTVMEKSRSLRVNIGTKEELASMRQSIESLDELKKEATETIDSLRTDVQSNRLGITEMFSMIYEAKAKIDQSKHETSIFMHQNQVQDRAKIRTLDRLVKQMSQCEMQVQLAVQVMNSQWANYQEAVGKNKKNRMHNPSLEGLYQTLTKQQEIIYRQNEKISYLKSKLGLKDNVLKQKSVANTRMESLSDSMISMTLTEQVQNENSKLTDKKLKNLRNLLANRTVVTIHPQRPERPGLDSEIIREKRIQTMKAIKKSETIVNPTLAVEAAKQQKQPQMPLGRQSEAFTGFGAPTSAQVPSFGLNIGNTMTKPSFGLSSAPVITAEKRKDDSFMSSKPFAPPAVSAVNPAPRLYVNPVAHKANEITKPPSTIANTSVAVTATFSIPLANKVAPAQNESRVIEKKQDENKPLTNNENTSFTFKLNENKDSSIKSTTPNFSALLPSSTEKSFSFGATNAPSIFSLGPKGATEDKTVKSFLAPTPSSTTAVPVFSGFGSSPATTSSSSVNATPFPSFSNSGFSLNLGSDATKSTLPAFSLNLTTPSTTEASKPTESFSFASMSSTVSSTADTKPSVSISLLPKPTTTAADSSFSFGAALSQLATNKPVAAPVPTSTMSFGNFGTTITTSGTPPVDLSKPPVSSSTSQPNTESTLDGLKACSPEVKPVLQSPPANIFGAATAPAAKTESSSIFGSSSFGSALGAALASNNTTNQAFGSPPPPPASSTVSPAAPVAAVVSPSPIVSSTQSQPTSIFGSQSPSVTAAPAPSLFGSLTLGTGDETKVTPTSPPTGLFSSMVKPDQSVFPSATNGVFGSQSSNVFGSSNAPTSPSIFGSANLASPTGNIFSSQPTTQSAATPSMFGQSASTNNASGGATGGSLFSQSSFSSSPSSNIFGASQAQPANASPFGGSSVFGGSQNSQQASTGSIFGGQSTFGSQPSTGSVFGGGAAPSPFGSASVFGGGATFSNSFGGGFGASAAPANVFSQQAPTFGGQATFGSPKSNIFGQQAAAGQSNNLFEQLGSQQSGNMFGSLAQNTQPAQQQQPPQAGFSGSAFSSWR